MLSALATFFEKINASCATDKLEGKVSSSASRSVLGSLDLVGSIAGKLDHVSMARAASTSEIWRKVVPRAILSNGKALNACMPSWPRQGISRPKAAPVCRPLPPGDAETVRTFFSPKLNADHLGLLIHNFG
jgi:hypothetical protein